MSPDETPTPAATRTRVSRRIAADPTSTALLLAGPSAFELWPGVRRVADVSGRVVVETVVAPDRALAASVRALPPRRTPTSYVSRFEWTGPGLPATSAELVLAYGAGSTATEATLVLESEDLPCSALGSDALRCMAQRFLANLARAAEQRSSAA